MWWLLSLFIGIANAQPAGSRPTPCPQIIDGQAVQSVVVTGSPVPIQYAWYDMKRSALYLCYFNRQCRYFVKVPRPPSGTIQWQVLSRYDQALMQEISQCPILTETHLPLLTR